MSMRRHLSRLAATTLFVILAALNMCCPAFAANVGYQGYLESDPQRQATMSLSFQGSMVQGTLTLPEVCQSNARLPGADFTLTGTINGPWEDPATVADLRWTGHVRWCGSSEDRQGTATIALRSGQGVYFLSQGSYYNRYIFTPQGKVHDPVTTSPPAPGGNAGNGPAPGFFVHDESSASLGPASSGFHSGITINVPGWNSSMITTLTMRRNEIKTINDTMQGIDGSSGRSIRMISCDATDYLVEGAVREVSRQASSVKIMATDEGIGRVYTRKTCLVERQDGSRVNGPVLGAYLILVGDKAVADYAGKPAPADGGPPYTTDIARAELKGRTVMRGSGKPVAGARISLIYPEGGALTTDNWLSSANGTFNINVTQGLASGTYEIMAHKISGDRGTAENPITTAKDLWPVKRYMVSLTKDKAAAGPIDVGTIELDTVESIFEKGKGREGSVMVGEPKPQPPPSGKAPAPPASSPGKTGAPGVKTAPAQQAPVSIDTSLIDKFQQGQRAPLDQQKATEAKAGSSQVTSPAPGYSKPIGLPGAQAPGPGNCQWPNGVPGTRVGGATGSAQQPLAPAATAGTTGQILCPPGLIPASDGCCYPPAGAGAPAGNAPGAPAVGSGGGTSGGKSSPCPPGCHMRPDGSGCHCP